MQGVVIKWKTMQRLRNPQNPPHLLFCFSLFHSTPASLAKWKSKWDVNKEERRNRQPSKPYVRYAVRQKRADAKRALKNLLLNGKSSQLYIKEELCMFYSETEPPALLLSNWDERLNWCDEETTNMRKDSSHSHSKNSKRSKGNGSHNGSKRWQNKSFYDDDDDDDCEQPEPKFSATFAGYKCYTWTYESWENCEFRSSTSGFEWRDDSKWEKAKKRVWSESDVEDDSTDVGSYSHRVALGLPPTGPLKLDDVKSAFRASALKWHPDKHQGPSQAHAGEKFKLCVDAYKSLCNSFKSI